MTEHNTNSATSDPLNRAFELVSRQFDGDLSAAEAEELAKVEESNAARIAEFREGCGRLQSALRQIPVKSVQCSLWDMPEAAVDKSDQMWSRRRTAAAWASIMVMTAGCLLLAIVRPWNESSLSSPQQTVASNDASTSEKSALSRVAPNGGVAEADAFVRAEGNSGSLSDTELLIQPLLESANWKIVVVQLDEKDRDVAMQKIQSVMHEHGLILRTATDAGSSDFVGIVLTSAVSRNDELVSAIKERVADSRVDRDLSRSAEARQDEIMEAFRNSLRYPTRSELHHGKVYVAISTEPSNGDSSTNSLLADTAATPGSTDATDATGRTARDSAEKRADRPIAAVTLVVFEFRSNEGEQDEDSPEPADDKSLRQPL